MKIVRHMCAAGCVLALAAPLPAASQSAPAPYKLNVKVQVSKLAPEIVNLIVYCQVKVGDTNIMFSPFVSQALTNNGFNGAVPIPLNYSDACPAAPKMACSAAPLKDARYECMMYTQDAALKLWYPTATAADAAADRQPPANWSYAFPAPGTPFAPIITGPFPPKASSP